MLKFILRAVTISSTLIFTLQANDWPNFRGSDHDGISKEKDLKLNFRTNRPNIAWKVSVNTGFSSMTTKDGKVYTMGHDGGKDYVYCLDASTGREIWQQSYESELQPNLYEGGPNSTPTIHDGLVYTLGKQGQIRCFDAKTGKLKWSAELKDYGYKKPQWGFSGSPYISGNLVIFNGGEAGIAFNAKTGKVAWKSDRGKASYATPVPLKLGSKDTILLFGAEALRCLNPDTGRQYWQHQWKTSYDVNGADPLIYGDDVFISSGYGRGGGLLEVDADSAKMKWEGKQVRTQFSTSVLIGDYIYGIDGNTNDGNAGLKCVRAKDGKVMWSERTGFGSLTAVNNTLLVLGERGQLISVEANPQQYKDNGKVQILGGKCWTSPIVSNGHLYARNAKGDLVSVKLK